MLEGQEELEQRTPEPPPQPQQPEPVQPSYEEALGVIAERHGYDPQAIEDALRIRQESERVYQESRRRLQDVEAREHALEAEREAALQVPPDYADPNQKWLYEQVRELRNDLKQQREERVREQNERQIIEERGAAIRSEFDALNDDLVRRGEKPVDENRFFAVMNRLRVPIEDARTAVMTTYGYLNSPLGRGAYTPQQRTGAVRGPRAEVVTSIPAGSGQSVGGSSPAINDIGAQRPGETIEQYAERLRRAVEESGVTVRALPEGATFSSG